MRCSESLEDWKQRIQNLTERVVRATEGCSPSILARHPAPDVWSPVQVVEHMVIGNRDYLQNMHKGLLRASKSPSDPPVRFSFLGKMIHKYAAHPEANAPAMKPLHPSPNPVWNNVFAEWQQQQAQILVLLDQARGIDVSRVSVGLPLFPVLRLNLADCFESLALHTERHVRQVEERVRQK